TPPSPAGRWRRAATRWAGSSNVHGGRRNGPLCAFMHVLVGVGPRIRLPSPTTHAQLRLRGRCWSRGACAELGAGSNGGGPAAVVGSRQSAGAHRRGGSPVRVLFLRYGPLPARVARPPEDQSCFPRRADPALCSTEHPRRRALRPEGGDAAAPPAPAPARVRRRARGRRGGLRPTDGDRARPGAGRGGGAEAAASLFVAPPP